MTLDQNDLLRAGKLPADLADGCGPPIPIGPANDHEPGEDVVGPPVGWVDPHEDAVDSEVHAKSSHPAMASAMSTSRSVLAMLDGGAPVDSGAISALEAALEALAVPDVSTQRSNAQAALKEAIEHGEGGDLAGTIQRLREAKQLASALVAPDPALVLGVRPLDVDSIFEPLPPIRWVCSDLQLGPGRCNLLVGYSGSAKSMVALSLCLAVSLGMPVLGRFETRHVHRVRYLSADSGTRAARGRAQRIARGMGATPDALRGRFDIVTRPTVHLTDPKAREAYTAAASGIDLLVVDALRPLIPNVEENASEVRAYIDIVTDVSEATGCTVLLLHHEGKSGMAGSRGAKPDDEAARGSASIQDAGGAIWRVIREEKDGGDVFHVKMSKPPEEPPGPKPEPFYFRIEDVEVDGDPRAGLELVHQTTADVNPPPPKPEPGAKLEEGKRRALAYIHAETRAGRAVAGKGALAAALEIRLADASAIVDALMAATPQVIEDRPESVGKGRPKPRLWAVGPSGEERS